MLTNKQIESAIKRWESTLYKDWLEKHPTANIMSDEKRNNSFERYKNQVQARMVAYGEGFADARAKVKNSLAYTSVEERGATNFLNKIKEKFAADYNDIRNLMRDRGRYTSTANIISHLEYAGDRKYILHSPKGDYIIDMTNSPEEVQIYAYYD